MRTRTKEPPMQVSPLKTRVTRIQTQPSPPGKPPAITPRKATRSTSNAGLAPVPLNIDAKVQAFRHANLFVVAGVNPEILQLYEFADQRRLSAANDAQQSSNSRAERRARRGSLHDANAVGGTQSQNGTSKRKRTSQDADNEDRSPKAKQIKRASDHADDEHGNQSDDQDADGDAASDESPRKTSNADDHYSKKPFPPPKSAIPIAVKRAPVTRRKRRGAAQGDSAVPSREATPPPELLPSDEDMLSDSELPSPFTDEPFDDPNLPDDAAQELYLKLYKPMTKAAAFVNALTKHVPERRSTDNLYALAANTAAALRLWQDEYLQLEKITAPHAAIPRKPATGQRNPLDHVVAEDLKEADLYDYVYDAKKVGFQNPLVQRVVRDASGRELRTRQPRGQSGISTANVVAEDAAVGRRARKPVTRFDGIPQSVAGSTRRRGQAVSETPEVEQPQPAARRGGRVAARGGRGGRGGRGAKRGGGRGGLLAKRIHEMRAESVASSSAPASEADEDEMSGSDDGRSSAPPQSQREDSMPAGDDDSAPNTPGPEYSPEIGEDGEGDGGFDAAGVALTASGKRKGRPKGSKNHHKRSDAGIPKGPRQPKSGGTGPSGSPLVAAGSPEEPEKAATNTSPAPTPPSDPKKKAPRSEKRSASMVEWWAKRKAKAAEEKAIQKAREQAEQAERSRAHHAAMQNVHAQVNHLGLPPMHHQFAPAPPPPPHLSHAPHPPPQPHMYGGYAHPGQGGYISPFGPPPPPPPRQGPPPGPPGEYRSPFPPTTGHPGFPHAPYAMPPPPLPHPSTQQQPPSSGASNLPPQQQQQSSGPSLPSIGQTIGWSPYPGGPPPLRQGSVYGPPPPVMHGGPPPQGVMGPPPGGYTMMVQQQGPPPPVVMQQQQGQGGQGVGQQVQQQGGYQGQQQQGQQGHQQQQQQQQQGHQQQTHQQQQQGQHQQGQHQQGQQGVGGRDQHGFVRTF